MLTYFLLALLALIVGLLLRKLTGQNWIWLVGLAVAMVLMFVFFYQAIQWAMHPPMQEYSQPGRPV